MSLQLSNNDVTYLAPDNKVRSAVSEQENKYKIYEIYVNDMFFPIIDSEKDEGVDLFITITPCSGLLKYYISDDYNRLFTSRSEIKHDSKFSKLDAKLEDLPDKVATNSIDVEHKVSRVTAGAENLNENDYNEFGIQGKRLKRVDRIVGKKLFIGIKALNWD